MNDQLVIRFVETNVSSESHVDWNLYNNSGEKQQSGNSLLAELYEQIVSVSEEFDINIIVPGDAILLASTQIPSTQLRHIKQALPFMVEELIADDIESVHMAIPQNLNKGNTVDVAIVSHRVIIDWLDILHSNQLSPNKLLIDVLCLPRHANDVCLLIDQDKILVRSDDYSGLVIDNDDFQLIFDSMITPILSSSDITPKPSINLIYSDTQSPESVEELSDNLRSHYSSLDIKVNQYDDSVLDILAGTGVFQHQPTINLLQGGYAIKQTNANFWQSWRVAASIAIFGLFAYLITTLGMGLYFDNKASKLDQQAVVLYKQLFPNERRVISPKKQMENHLRLSGSTGNAHFLQLLAETSSQLSDDNSKLVAVEALRFDSDVGDLVFQVQSPSIDSLEKIKQLMAQQGLTVDINSATEQDNYVVGRFAVRR